MKRIVLFVSFIFLIAINFSSFTYSEEEMDQERMKIEENYRKENGEIFNESIIRSRELQKISPAEYVLFPERVW